MEDNRSKQAGPEAIPGAITRLAEISESLATATRQAFYVWDIGSDRIRWSRNFEKLAGLGEGETRHLSGRSFESMLGSESLETRFGTIFSGHCTAPRNEPVTYQCTYLLVPSPSKEPVWIEDTGCWFGDETGKPLYAEGCIRVINERRNREENLRRKSDYDDLTGLPNRRFLEKSIDETIKVSEAEGRTSTFLLLALDRMELINDIYGFEAGDQALKQVGEIIRRKLRANDLVCRFSGAKFGVILNGCPPAEIYDAGNRLLDAISENVVETSAGYISLSGVVGACFLPKHADTPKQAIHCAFKAIERARHETARRVAAFTLSKSDCEESDRKARFSETVVHAIREELICLAFQPVCRRDGKVAFYETLVRLTDRDGNVVKAVDFIKTTEELGLIRLVDRHALKLVIETLEAYPDAVLSVNVSPDTVMDPNWLSALSVGLAGIPGSAERLIVEVTESMAVTDLEETRRFFENIRSLGCRIAIDDFGAGFTSFYNLRALPVDIIKIDGSFGINLAASTENQAFVQALLALAKAFDIETVVEWVEDAPTSDLLNGWQVDYQQGHQMGHPVLSPPWTGQVKKKSA